MTARSVLTALLLFAAAPALADHPVAGAPVWLLIDSPERDCWAETGAGAKFAPGDTLHIKLMVNIDGNLVIAGARPDWRANGRVVFRQTIDQDPPEAIDGSGVMSLVLAEITEPDMMERLRRAMRLTWKMPWGSFSAKVTGLGAAFDAVAECRRQKRGEE